MTMEGKEAQFAGLTPRWTRDQAIRAHLACSGRCRREAELYH
jgi:hypothetical protein